LTHADAAGRVQMVDVSVKPVTTRRAVARGRVVMSAAAARALSSGALPKGDGLAVARVAAIMAVKRTPEWIPLCHPIGVDGVEVDLRVGPGWVDIEVAVTTQGRTGAEMEALTGVAAAGLTLIDMVKAIDRQAVITDVRLVAKSGGRSGTWTAPDPPPVGPDPRHVVPDLLRDLSQLLERPAIDMAPDDGSSQSGVTRGGPPAPPPLPRTGVVTVSDRRCAGQADDLTGPLIAQALPATIERRTVPDEAAAIQQAVRDLAATGCQIILTTGGTGIGPRDVTPEALAPLIDQQLPGLAEALRQRGLAQTPMALISRQVAGVMRRGDQPVLLVGLPGSPAAVRDGLGLLVPLLAHLVGQMRGGDHEPPRGTEPG
jgi:cyclic pyranopterin phosphate synthase